MTQELLRLAESSRMTIDGVVTAEASREFQSDNSWRRHN